MAQPESWVHIWISAIYKQQFETTDVAVIIKLIKNRCVIDE